MPSSLVFGVPCSLGRESRWLGLERRVLGDAASSALVSRSRAMPVGDRRSVLPVGPAVARHPALDGLHSRGNHVKDGTRREGSHPDGWGLRRRGPAGRCADRRSAFPCGRRHLDGWGSRAGLHFHRSSAECAAVPCLGAARGGIRSGSATGLRPPPAGEARSGY